MARLNDEMTVLGEDTTDDESDVTYDITSYPSDLTLKVISDMWKNDDFTVPEFQRNFVWTIKQASLLIDSFLRDLPVPQVFLYVDDDDNKLHIIDGLQRLMSIVYFFEGYFGTANDQGKRQVFKLTGLSKKNSFANKTYNDLEENLQRKLRGAVLRAINIRQMRPANDRTSVYHIFERLNTGGTPLRPQEIRNCVFNGEFVKVLRQLNNNSDWRKIIGRRNPDKHQKDIELILKIFAFSENASNYERPLKDFLNAAMSRNISGNTQKVKDFIPRFEKACSIILEKFGSNPFHTKRQINVATLDSVFCTIMDNLNALPVDLENRYKKLKEDANFTTLTAYGTSDIENVKNRFRLAKLHLIKS